MNKLHFIREQITIISEEIAQKEGKLNELMTLMLMTLIMVKNSE